MVVRGSRQETLDPGFVLLGTRQQGVPVILMELVLPGGFNLVSPSSTVRNLTTELPELRPTSCYRFPIQANQKILRQQFIYSWSILIISCCIVK
ncbi:unnamed protein product [Schistosoma margrebowiei]|uniref:Uncharacterized protein n=1 Tax=Schistosoma margrebowiei TaxID=48269 RepID=A0A183MJF8_9TREM|nr:unnamed protein product [Schistosoma margrebowiei]